MQKEISFSVSLEQGRVSVILNLPKDALAGLVIAHGAGTDMRHQFMEELSSGLAESKIATFRFNFPYKEKGKGGPNSANILKQTIREAVKNAQEEMPDLALFAGGKSMGGRMTSLAASEETLANIKGLIFFGFPLHAAGKPGTERAEHLAAVDHEMLFLQGPRDALAKPELLLPIIKKLGSKADVHMVEGADHSFKVLKRSDRTQADVIEELIEVAGAWMKSRIA